MIEMIKLGLFTVTYSGHWYKGKCLSLKEQILKAKQMGFDGLSIEARRPVASPVDFDKKALRDIKEFSKSQGIPLCAVEAMSNFASPIPEERENNLAMVKETLRMAEVLEVPIVKVFAAWRGVTLRDGDTPWTGFASYVNEDKILAMFGMSGALTIQRWQWAVEGITEAAKWAEDYGITVALQNHSPLVGDGYENALAMINEVGLNNAKLCLDVPLFDAKQDDAYVHEAVEACKDLIVHSHCGSWNIVELPSGEVIQRPWFGRTINYKAFVKELKRIGYDGYIASEHCAPLLVNHRYGGIEEIDKNVRATVKYMRKLFTEA